MTELGVKTFEAKISLKNQPSIDMFCSKLGFRERSVSTIFEEVTLDWKSSTAPKIDGEEDMSEPSQEELETMQRIEKQILGFWEDNVRSTTWENKI
jgi:hypothetical protein